MKNRPGSRPGASGLRCPAAFLLRCTRMPQGGELARVLETWWAQVNQLNAQLSTAQRSAEAEVARLSAALEAARQEAAAEVRMLFSHLALFSVLETGCCAVLRYALSGATLPPALSAPPHGCIGQAGSSRIVELDSLVGLGPMQAQPPLSCTHAHPILRAGGAPHSCPGRCAHPLRCRGGPAGGSTG